MDLMNVLTFSYWFSSSSNANSLTIKVIWLVFLVVLLFSISGRYFLKKLKKAQKIHYIKKAYYDRFLNKLIIYSAIIVVWAFFRQEGVYILSARIIGLVIFCLAIVHLFLLYKKIKREVPVKLNQLERKEIERSLKIKHWLIKDQKKKKKKK